jgi:large conductance mechanosensitive channel
MSYAALKEAGVPMLGYGQFATVLLGFLILAFIVFHLVRAANRARALLGADDEAPAAAPPEDILLLREIRDALRARS